MGREKRNHDLALVGSKAIEAGERAGTKEHWPILEKVEWKTLLRKSEGIGDKKIRSTQARISVRKGQKEKYQF